MPETRRGKPPAEEGEKGGCLVARTLQGVCLALARPGSRLDADWQEPYVAQTRGPPEELRRRGPVDGWLNGAKEAAEF